MATTARKIPRLTPEEYLERERDNPFKHEFSNGLVYAMASAGRLHNSIMLTLASALEAHLPEHCSVYAADVKVHIRSSDDEFYVYPDVFVSCSDLDADKFVSQHPVLVVEILSPNTEDYDRTEKFDSYRLLPSLQEYGLLAQDTRKLEVFRRRSNWTEATYEGDDLVTFESVGLTVPVSSIYKRVQL